MFIFFMVQTSQKTSVNKMSTYPGIVEGKEMTNGVGKQQMFPLQQSEEQ